MHRVEHLVGSAELTALAARLDHRAVRDHRALDALTLHALQYPARGLPFPGVAAASARRAAKIVDKEASHKRLKEDTISKLVDRLDKVRSANGKISVADLRLKMQKTMQNHAAVFRTKETLVEGQEMIDAIRKEYENIRINDRSMITNTIFNNNGATPFP